MQEHYASLLYNKMTSAHIGDIAIIKYFLVMTDPGIDVKIEVGTDPLELIVAYWPQIVKEVQNTDLPSHFRDMTITDKFYRQSDDETRITGGQS